MLKRCYRLLAVDAATGVVKPDLGIPEFVDPSFIANKRPLVPGGAWPKECLAQKSLSDLQQIWFVLLKERNMLLSMKEHYMRHPEELGAWPAPSRLKMVEESMASIKEVVQERDFQATEKAMEIFKERLKKGMYRYPPGPQPPPESDDDTSTVRITLSHHVSEERLRELFGFYDRFENHKGIGIVRLSLPPEVMDQKEKAEEAWEDWRARKIDFEDYQRMSQPSAYDVLQDIELAPGIRYATKEQEAFVTSPESASESVFDSAEVVVASNVTPPPPRALPPRAADPLQRIRDDARPITARRNLQLGYFPNITTPVPSDPGPRPVHPDEIAGPWVAELVYDTPGGFKYASALNITSIDGAKVLSVEDVPKTTPFAERCPIYQEALRAEEADSEMQSKFPQIPYMDRYEVKKLRRKPIETIILEHWSNVIDYTEREALMTGKSIYDLPVHVDPSCGDADRVPPGWKDPNEDSVVDLEPKLSDSNY